MRSHSRLRDFFARRNGEERWEHPVIAIESFVPLLLATHGVILLFWHGNMQPWPWLILGGLFVLGALRLAGWYEFAYLSYGRALYILLATWLLMYNTDGAASNFMLWNFVLVAVYPIILRFPSAPLLPPVVAVGYLLLFLAGPPVSLSRVTLFSRTFLLCFIGWLTYQLGTSLQRQAQTYRQAAEALAKEQSQLHEQIDFNQAVLNSLSAHIAVLDKEGVIIAVNRAWQRFATQNGSSSAAATGVRANYLAVCDNATGEGAAEAATAAARIRDVIAGLLDHDTFEYACHSPTEQRWFLFHVVPWMDGAGGAVISHTNITKRKEAEEALRQSEARNRALVEAIPDAIGRIHRDGTCLDMRTPSNFAMTVSPAAAIGKKLTDYLPPAVAQQNMDAIEQALATGELQVVEYQLASDRGVQVRETRIVPDAKDEVITIIRDITTRRLTEEALRKSEVRNRVLLEAIPDAVVRIHRNGTYLDAKDPADFVPVISAEQVVGKHVRDLLPPSLAQQFLAVAQQTLDKNERQIFEYELKIGEEMRMREARVVPVGEDETIFILRDITERKQTEMALNQSEERYRTLAELSPDAILVNEDGHYVYANSAAAQLFGAKAPQELVGHAPFDFLAPEHHSFVSERIRWTLEEKRPAPPMEFPIRRLDGVPVYVEVTAAPSIWNGRPSVQVMMRDSTVRKQAEAEKSRLYMEVSQQRAQLRTLTGRLTEVQDEERKTLARELHDQVGQNLSTLGLELKVIETQLTTPSPVAGQIQPLLTDAQALVKQVTEQVRTVMTELRPPLLDDYGLPAALEWYANRVAKQAHFKVQMAAAEELPRLPSTIENGLFRIAQEAIINIMKYAQATLVAITIASDGQQVTLTIADDGRGFDPNAVNRASERVGWGLLSMQERTEALGGHFTIESEPGQGARVAVVIPYRLS